MRMHALVVVIAVASCGGPKSPHVVPDPGPGSSVGTSAGSDVAAPATEPAVPGSTVKPELIAEDSPRTTTAGVVYTAPAGWTLTASGSIVILAAQDGDSWAAIVDATANEPDAAVAEAWKLYRSTPAPKLKLAVDTPAREGWEQARDYAYEIPPNDKRVAAAAAVRHGTPWTVVIFDASIATANKRSAQFALLGQSIRPKGYDKESFNGKTANKLDAARLAKLDEMIEVGRSELGIPGVAVAIVQDGKVIHSKGYGMRQLGKKQAVDPNTLFIIASNTKAMTTLLLAQLVDDGKLKWDQPVTEVYPDFKLGDAATTASTTISHLICACTGLPRKDFEWLFEFGKATALTELSYLAAVQPTTKFGETFQYSNLMATAAGYVAAHVISPKVELGKAYDAAMKARIFAPLGMKTTTFDFAKALRGNHATPHSWNLEGKTAVSPMDLNYSIYPMRPAGGAWSSASELIKYVQLELGKGVAPGGKRLVSEENILRRQQPSVTIGEDGAYGMGLMTSKKHGVLVVSHGGSMIGFKSDMLWLPEHGVGAVILTNSDLGQLMLGAFRRYLLELLFDGKPEALEDLKSSAETTKKALLEERSHLTVPPDPEAIGKLAKKYANDALGPITVSTKKGVTTFDFGEWKTEIATRKNDDGTMSMVAITPGQDGFQFVVGATAEGKRTLTLRDAQHEYVFVES